VLYRHPNDIFRFLYIQDTLDNCPMPSIKAFAVQWMKREIMVANAVTKPADEDDALFSKSIPLFTLASCFWPDLSHEYPAKNGSTPARGENAFAGIRANYGFYAASANFLYFLLLRRPLHQQLELRGVLEDADCAKNFVEPLLQAVLEYKIELDKHDEDSTALSLLEMVLRDVIGQLKTLGWCSLN
jgi:hypothetical protein